MANDLAIPQLTEGQASPEVTTNDATAALGNALANKFDADVTSGNVSVTAAQYRGAILTRVINATTTRTVTLPAVEREFALVESDSANTADVSLVLGSTTVTLHPGRLYLIRTDGTANGLKAKDIGGANNPLMLEAFIPGVLADGQLLYVYVALRPFTLPTNLAGSVVKTQVAATGSTVITFKKNGSSIGTSTIASSGTTGTHSVTATSFAVGDFLTVFGPGTHDATAADFLIALLGNL